MGFINPKDAHALQSATDTEAAAPALITVLMKRGYSDSGYAHWGLRPWRTRRSNRPWLRSSIRSTRRIFSAFRMVFVQDVASTKRWMHCRMRS